MNTIDDVGFRVVDEGYRKGRVLIYSTKAPTRRAILAMQLLERWGMVAAHEDGEDTAGRQKFRLLLPDELVSRACETADQAIMEIEKRGWYLEIPAPTDATEDAL